MADLGAVGRDHTPYQEPFIGGVIEVFTKIAPSTIVARQVTIYLRSTRAVAQDKLSDAITGLARFQFPPTPITIFYDVCVRHNDTGTQYADIWYGKVIPVAP